MRNRFREAVARNLLYFMLGSNILCWVVLEVVYILILGHRAKGFLILFFSLSRVKGRELEHSSPTIFVGELVSLPEPKG